MPTWQPKFDSQLLHDPGNGFFVQAPETPSEQRIATEDVPRRHGSVVVEEIVSDSRIVTVHGAVKKAVAAQVRSAIEDIARATKGVQSGSLYLWDDRYITARLKSFSGPKYVDGAALLAADYDLEFLCDDPFFYAAALTSNVNVVTSAPTTYTEWTETNVGSRIAYPVITITANISGNISAFSLSNQTTGKGFTWSGTVSSGTSLVVNCAARTVTNNGTADLSGWASGNIFWWLNNGANTIRLTGANATVTIAYHAPYYEM